MIDQYRRNFVVISFDGKNGRFIGSFTELKVAEAYASFISDLNPDRTAQVFRSVDGKKVIDYPALNESEVHGD